MGCFLGLCGVPSVDVEGLCAAVAGDEVCVVVCAEVGVGGGCGCEVLAGLGVVYVELSFCGDIGGCLAGLGYGDWLGLALVDGGCGGCAGVGVDEDCVVGGDGCGCLGAEVGLCDGGVGGGCYGLGCGCFGDLVDAVAGCDDCGFGV